jgi:hypothetical protein
LISASFSAPVFNDASFRLLYAVLERLSASIINFSGEFVVLVVGDSKFDCWLTIGFCELLSIVVFDATISVFSLRIFAAIDIS